MNGRLAAVLFAISLVSCAPEPAPKVRSSSGHGYALLQSILEQERQVSKLLIIKEERDALQAVIQAIADTCGKAYERLEELAEKDRSLELADTGLPSEELKTREAIAATRQKLLLGTSGRELELELLMMQNEALTYIAHLADTLARSEPDAERLAFVRALWEDANRLRQDVVALLRRPGPPAG